VEMTGRRTAPASKASQKRCCPSHAVAQVKRGRKLEVKKPTAEQREMCGVLHQLGFVEDGYDSKADRLQQLFDRIPVQSSAVAVFAEASSVPAVKAAVERYRQREAARSSHVARKSCHGVPTPCSASSTFLKAPKDDILEVRVLTSASSLAAEEAAYVINYDVPKTSCDYLRHLSLLMRSKTIEPKVVYSFIEESKLKSKPCRALRALFQRAKTAAAGNPELGGIAKATEFDSVIEQMEDEEEEEDEDDEDDDDCCCAFCNSCGVGQTSYHTAMRCRAPGIKPAAVEVVRLQLKALEDMDAAAPLIAPRVPGHVGTVICLHCLNYHDPWDGWEHLFAMPGLGGHLRVVFLLADECSWHDYPDSGTLGAGGVPWMDILDVDSMDRADKLLERLVDHEAALLNGQSERVVLMGMSQGGGQSMLRFLRSRRRLGGWLGAVCHVPTAPHTTRDRDPLLLPARPTVNCDRPVRLLAGEEDSVFPPGLVLRDVERLRHVGGFRDVEIEVRRGLSHEGNNESVEEGMSKARAELMLGRARMEVPELLFLRQHLPAMLGIATES